MPIRLALKDSILGNATKLILSKLDLRSNPYLKDAGLKPLLPLLGPSRVKTLILNNTGISEIFVE